MDIAVLGHNLWVDVVRSIPNRCVEFKTAFQFDEAIIS